MLWLLALAPALAEPVGHFSPEEVAKASALYAQASEQAGGAFEEASSEAASWSVALQDYEEALDLLGPLAAPAERDRLELLRKQYNRDRATFTAFANTMMEDFDGEFSQALERALSAVEGETQVCASRVAIGQPLPGMPVRTQANPDCVGENLNASLAAAMDADAALQSAVGEILELEWPAWNLEVAPQPPVGVAPEAQERARTVQVHAFFSEGAGDRLARIHREEEQAREDFQAALEQEATEEELQRLLVASRELTATTQARRARVGAMALPAVDGVWAKWTKKGEPPTGWCANPSNLGGCTGEDATRALVPRTLEARKVSKALGR